jgi:hypothetical protein
MPERVTALKTSDDRLFPIEKRIPASLHEATLSQVRPEEARVIRVAAFQTTDGSLFREERHAVEYTTAAIDLAADVFHVDQGILATNRKKGWVLYDRALAKALSEKNREFKKFFQAKHNRTFPMMDIVSARLNAMLPPIYFEADCERKNLDKRHSKLPFTTSDGTEYSNALAAELHEKTIAQINRHLEIVIAIQENPNENSNQDLEKIAIYERATLDYEEKILGLTRDTPHSFTPKNHPIFKIFPDAALLEREIAYTQAIVTREKPKQSPKKAAPVQRPMPPPYQGYKNKGIIENLPPLGSIWDSFTSFFRSPERD